jgi:hypothetical protein
MSFPSSHQTQIQLNDQSNPSTTAIEILNNCSSPNPTIESSQHSNQNQIQSNSCKINECSLAESVSKIDEITCEKNGKINSNESFQLNESLDKQILNIIQNDENYFARNTILNANQTKKNELNLFSEIEALKSKFHYLLYLN